MIKAVIFDADGPLYYRSPEVTEKKQLLLTKFGYHGTIQDFEAAYESEKFKGYVATETVEQMFQNILHTIGLEVTKEDATLFTKEFGEIQSHITPAEKAVEILHQLNTEGYEVCVLTDSFYPSIEKWRWFKALGMNEYIDFIVDSYDIHKLKDAPEAYKTCLDRLKVNADEVVFVGHQEYEMVGARTSGVTSIALQSIASLNIHADYMIDSLAELPELLKKL